MNDRMTDEVTSITLLCMRAESLSKW